MWSLAAAVQMHSAMENFWMYQAEKLEEEEAKQTQLPQNDDKDKVWNIVLKCFF